MGDNFGETTDDDLLAAVLRRFLESSTEYRAASDPWDNGRGESGPAEVELDGKVTVTADELAAVRRAMAL